MAADPSTTRLSQGATNGFRTGQCSPHSQVLRAAAAQSFFGFWRAGVSFSWDSRQNLTARQDDAVPQDLPELKARPFRVRACLATSAVKNGCN